MSKFSRLVLMVSLLILTSGVKPQMIMMSSENYSPSGEKWLLEMKAQYLTGKKNSQIVFTPIQLENGIITTYFFWEEDGQVAETQDNDRIVAPKSIDISKAEKAGGRPCNIAFLILFGIAGRPLNYKIRKS